MAKSKSKKSTSKSKTKAVANSPVQIDIESIFKKHVPAGRINQIFEFNQVELGLLARIMVDYLVSGIYYLPRMLPVEKKEMKQYAQLIHGMLDKLEIDASKLLDDFAEVFENHGQSINREALQSVKESFTQ